MLLLLLLIFNCSFGQGHSCGWINGASKNSKKRIIVIEGKNGNGYLTDVEIFDEEQKTWNLGPELPIGISQAGLVEDSNGGVVLVGGDSGSGDSQKTLCRLTHFESSAACQLMKQKLIVGRFGQVTFLVANDVTDCKQTL